MLDALVDDAKPDGMMDAARAIMTTDTYPKVATAHGQARRRRGDDQRHGQGRRHDRARHGDDAVLRLHRRADRRAGVAGAAVEGGADSFNAITVDSDTSTSDTLLLFATGAAAQARRAGDRRRRRSRGSAAFKRALDEVLLDLAHQVVRDGEGARKFVEVRSKAPRSRKAAKRIALSIANSPLVKTAIAGEDANWGRVVMAVGKAGEKAERDKLAICFGAIRVAHEGLRDPAYDEAAASAYMKSQDIVITVELGIGAGEGDGVDLRPHQGIRRDQRRLSLVKLTLVVAVALVDADDRVLIAQRPEGKALAGLWEFPGGKIEPGERPGGGADPRAARGARHRGQGALPGAADLRQPRLRRLPPADAALRLPQVAGFCAARARARRSNGSSRRRCATIRCRRPTRR